MFTLYHDWDSVCSFKVRMCLEEKGIEYLSRRVNLNRFEHLQEDYREINPNCLVPTLDHAGHTIVESSIINEFLDQVHTASSLVPNDAYAIAKMRVLVKLQDDVLYHAQRPATFQLMVKRMLSNLSREEVDTMVKNHPEPARAEQFLNWATGPVDELIVDEAKRNVRPVLEKLETALADGPWLAGDTFSLAECAYAPFVDRLRRLMFDVLWADQPKVRAWVERLSARPSFVAAIGPEEFRMPCPADG